MIQTRFLISESFFLIENYWFGIAVNSVDEERYLIVHNSSLTKIHLGLAQKPVLLLPPAKINKTQTKIK